MKKNNFQFFGAITLLIIIIISIYFFKFVINKNEKGVFIINKIEAIQIIDQSKNPINLMNILEKNEETYCLLFELNNCSTCIFKGIDDLNGLKKEGLDTIAIIVHDSIEEINGWSKNYNYSNFYMLKKSDFYKNITSSILPVLIRIKDGKVKNYRFIIP